MHTDPGETIGVEKSRLDVAIECAAYGATVSSQSTAGRKGLASKWRSKPSNHQRALQVVQRATDLIPARCQGFGPTLAQEELVDTYDFHCLEKAYGRS